MLPGIKKYLIGTITRTYSGIFLRLLRISGTAGTARTGR